MGVVKDINADKDVIGVVKDINADKDVIGVVIGASMQINM